MEMPHETSSIRHNNIILDIKNLSVIFHTEEGNMSAIRDLSLSIGQGEILAVVGESGCGKSVLCKTVMGLLPRTAEITGGSIWLKPRISQDLRIDREDVGHGHKRGHAPCDLRPYRSVVFLKLKQSVHDHGCTVTSEFSPVLSRGS